MRGQYLRTVAETKVSCSEGWEEYGFQTYRPLYRGYRLHIETREGCTDVRRSQAEEEGSGGGPRASQGILHKCTDPLGCGINRIF